MFKELKSKSLLFITMFIACIPAFATTYYVAVNGNDRNTGSLEYPFASLQKANTMAKAGDTVWIRAGIYFITDTLATSAKVFAGINITSSGESDTKPVCYFAYPGDKRPVFDFSKTPISTPTSKYIYTHGFVIQGKYIHFKGFDVRGTTMNSNSNTGIFVYNSTHIYFDQVNSYNNSGSGFFVNDTRGGGGHRFINCDSHDNYDPNGRQGDGQNADGFGVHYQTSGDTTKFYGCRAWWNSDDGWDFISQEFPVVIENSYAMGHGYAYYGTFSPKDGNGNGFKAGSSKTGIRHTIRQCYAWKNKAGGFYANHSAGGNDWFNNTSYSNGSQFNMWASSWDAAGNRTDGVILKGDKAHVMKNNIAYPEKLRYIGGEYANGEYNTWNLGIVPSDTDFLSLDDPSMTIKGEDISMMAGMLGPRKADGSLPDVDFLKLAPNSQLIDRGIDVGLPYAGISPDLGAYEIDLVSENKKDSTTTPIDSSSVKQDSADIQETEPQRIFTKRQGVRISNKNQSYSVNGKKLNSTQLKNRWIVKFYK